MTGAPSPTDAAEALASIDATRAQLLCERPQKTAWPIQLASSAILSGFVAANAAPPVWAVVIDAGLIGLIYALVKLVRARHRVFVSGWRAGPMRAVGAGITLAYVAACCVSLWFKLALGIWWAPLLAAAILLPLAFAGHRLWRRAFRMELESRR